MISTDLNPYQRPAIQESPERHVKSGWLLWVSLGHIALEGTLLIACSIVSSWCVLAGDYGKRMDEHILLACIMLSAPVMVLILKEEVSAVLFVRRQHELKLIRVLSCLTILPFGLGCFSLSEWIRFGGPDLIPAVISFVIALFWWVTVRIRKSMSRKALR